MKTRNLFFAALTCLAFAACSDDDNAVQNPQSESEKRAYIAVQFSMPGATETRAADLEYANADPAEYAADDAAFFFFDNYGNPAATPCYIDNIQDLWGDLTHDHDTETDDAQTGSDEKESTIVLVVKNPKATLSKVVAVLNPTEKVIKLATKNATVSGDGKDYELNGVSASSGVYLNKPTDWSYGENELDLGDLYEVYSSSTPYYTSETEITGSFVMSNSVYYDGTVINATPVLKSYLKEKREDATKNPLIIHVERVWAKVAVNAKLTTDDEAKVLTSLTSIETNTKLSNTDETPLKLKVTGWWLNNTNKNSYLLKNISNTEYVWNDKNEYRSYWANAYTPSSEIGNYGHSTYTDAAANIYDKYCLENTSTSTYTYKEKSVTTSTQVVVAATIYTDDATKAGVSVISYQGLYYTETDFLNNVATYLNNCKYTKTVEGSDVAIQANDLHLVFNTSTSPNTVSKDYLAQVQINNNSLTIKKDGTSSDITAINNDLKDIYSELKYWKDGKTYFFTKVEHDYSSTEKEKTPAIIRNHLYQVTVTGLTGMGTPVPNPDIPVIPVIPDNDKESFLACKIAVLKYRTVEQEVTLGGDANQQ